MFINTKTYEDKAKDSLSIIENLLIIGILVALVTFAMPSLRDGNVRGKVSECLGLAAPVRTQIVDHQKRFNSWPRVIKVQGLAHMMVSEHCDGFTAYDPLRGSFKVNVNETGIRKGLARLQPLLIPLLKDGGQVEWDLLRGDTLPGDVKFLPAKCHGLELALMP